MRARLLYKNMTQSVLNDVPTRSVGTRGPRGTLLRLAPVLTGIAVVLVAGLVHGIWTQRWHRSAELEEATARLADLPRAVGDWKGEASELDQQDLAAAGATGYWMQRFTHRRSGA